MSDRTFEYLLNAFEQASQSPTPAELHYAAKRKAVLDHEAELRAEVRWLRDLLGQWNGFQAVAFIHTQKVSTVSLIVETARALAPAVGHLDEKGAKP